MAFPEAGLYFSGIARESFARLTSIKIGPARFELATS
jgi:hypothetical protein